MTEKEEIDLKEIAIAIRIILIKLEREQEVRLLEIGNIIIQ